MCICMYVCGSLCLGVHVCMSISACRSTKWHSRSPHPASPLPTPVSRLSFLLRCQSPVGTHSQVGPCISVGLGGLSGTCTQRILPRPKSGQQTLQITSIFASCHSLLNFLNLLPPAGSLPDHKPPVAFLPWLPCHVCWPVPQHSSQPCPGGVEIL